MFLRSLLKYLVPGVGLALFAAGLMVLPLYSAGWVVTAHEAVPAFELESQSTRVSLAAVGDVMLARKVGRLMEKYGNVYPVKEVAERLSRADLTFGNLESPIGTGGRPLPQKGIWFRAKPDAAETLIEAGFDLVSVANNHALDYDREAFLETLDILSENNILAVGGGESIHDARKPVIVKKNGLKIGFLAYSEMADIIWSRSYPRMLMATENQPGIAPAGPAYVDEMLADVKDLAEKVDVVVLSLHWGNEYQYRPGDSQRELAHRLIDAGADLIIGHHPHTLQGLERYKHGLIAYSLGNFIFDQNFSRQTTEGLLLEVTLSPLGVESAAVSPVVIPQSQPKVAAGAAADRINRITAELSRELGLDFGWQPGTPALVLEDTGMKI